MPRHKPGSGGLRFLLACDGCVTREVPGTPFRGQSRAPSLSLGSCLSHTEGEAALVTLEGMLVRARAGMV